MLAACGSGGSSSSSAEPALEAQAVDGYIVGASVFCDGVPSGGTAAGGLFVCPLGTVLASISGGEDVGFDPTATSGGLPFVGELVAPPSLGWVTPLSTIAVAMASDGDDYDGARLAESIDALAAALGQSTLDLSVDPTATSQLYRLNAQVHQLVGAFAATEDDYRETTRALAAFVRGAADEGRAYSLGNGAGEFVGALNADFAARGSRLALDADVLAERIARLQEVNGEIERAERPDLVFGAAMAAPVAGQALTLERDAAVVGYEGVSLDSKVSLDDFASADLQGSVPVVSADGSMTSMGTHRTVVDGSGTLFLYDDAFGVDRTLRDQRVSLGFELVATGEDAREIAVTTSDARVSAVRGDSESVTITLPAGSALRVRHVADDETVTTATIVLARDHAFLAENGHIDLSFWRIDRELERRGFGDLTARAGNYRMTVAIGGLRVNERDGGTTRRATVRRVDSGDEVVSGSGIRGYVTILPGSYWY